MKKALLKMCFVAVTLLCFMVSHAQQKHSFNIAGFRLDQQDLTASVSEYSKKDASGSNYAIFKVHSTNPDDNLQEYTFDFGSLNSMRANSPNDDELWLYVQKNAKTVTISRPGYNTVRNYDLGLTVEPGKVYTMQLSSSAIPVSKQIVVFEITPPRSKATILYKSAADDYEQVFGKIDEEGIASKSLPLGSYTYRIVTEDNLYRESKGNFNLNDRNKTFTERVTLKPEFSEVVLRSAPDAQITVDGERTSTGVWRGPLSYGNHHVSIARKGHENASQYIKIEEGGNTTFELDSPRPILGTLAVMSTPSGARIFVDGEEMGKTPASIDVLIGDHTVEILKENYQSEMRNVTIQKNYTTDISVTLGSKGNMTINSNPTYAQLYIDGKYVGKTPYTAQMASGDYNLRLEQDGYKTVSKRVHLDLSHPNVSVNLSRVLFKEGSAYLQLGYQMGGVSAPVVSFGAIAYFGLNFEGFWGMAMKKNRFYDYHYWPNIIDGQDWGCRYMHDSSVRPMFYGGKIGYGVAVSRRIRLTPQVGYMIVHGNSSSGPDSFCTHAFCYDLRFEIALSRGFSIVLMPQGRTPVKKGEAYKKISETIPSFKDWGSGYEIFAGFSINM